MQNRTGAAGAALGARARQTLRAHRLEMEYLVCAVTGFLSANAFVLGGLAPFGVAFAAAAKKKDYAAAVLGATLGYLASFRLVTNIKYVAAMLLLFLLRWGGESGSFARSLRIPRLAFCAAALGIPSLALMVISGGGIYDLLLAVSEVLLACCAGYFFSRTIHAMEEGLENARQSDITSVMITFCIAILALVNLHLFGLSVGRVLACLTILLAAQAAREAGGAIAGVAAGVSAGLLGGGQAFLMGTYGFGGLLAGVFAPLGRFASAGVFILINLFAMLASRSGADYHLLAEIFVASAFSMLISTERMQRLAMRGTQGDAVQEDTYREMLTGRIENISGALRDVAETTRRVNEKLAGMVSGDVSSVYHCAADEVCRRCRNRTVCWQLRYSDTSNVMNDMLGVLRRTGRLSELDFPDYFARACPSLAALSEQISRKFAEFTARETMRRKVAQVRGVVTDQFEGMALMIDSMGRELGALAAQDSQTAAQVRTYLESLSVFPDRVSCTLDSGANMTLELVIPVYKFNRLGAEELTCGLSELCGREFELPARRDSLDKTICTLTFTEKAFYTVRWGASQAGSGESRLCGDSYSYADPQVGRVNIILSDGMGSGGAAAVDSTMTAELLKRLIEAGVSLDAALKLVNSALLVKSGEESLATIDITGVDLYTGCAEFYKAGAAPTFLRKSGKGGYVESSSLPVGILGGVSFEKNAVTLREGDVILMVSDGAVTSGYGWIVSELEHFSGDDPKELSERIVTEAKRRRNDGHEDDVTAIAVILERC